MTESPRPEVRSYLTQQSWDSLWTHISSSRIRLTCLDVSTNYILLGANTGSLYVFDRDSSKFVQLLTIDGLQGGMAIVRFSPDEKYLAFVTAKSPVINIMEFSLKVRKSDKDLIKIATHRGEVSCFVWSGMGNEAVIYSGDEQGAIFKTSIGSRKNFLGVVAPEFLYQCDSKVVQMSFDVEKRQLLFSSLTRSVLIDFNKTLALQVGKNLRDGVFGGTHYRGDINGKELVLARPGLRLWLADCDTAMVKQTVNFQSSIEVTPAMQLFSETPVEMPNPVNFAKMAQFGECVLSWNEKGIIFLIDADHHRILQWHYDAVNLQDLVVFDSTAYIIYGDKETKVTRFTFNLQSFMNRLIEDKDWNRFLNTCKRYSVTDFALAKKAHEVAVENHTPETVVQELAQLMDSLDVVKQKQIQEAKRREAAEAERQKREEEVRKRQAELEEQRKRGEEAREKEALRKEQEERKRQADLEEQRRKDQEEEDRRKKQELLDRQKAIADVRTELLANSGPAQSPATPPLSDRSSSSGDSGTTTPSQPIQMGHGGSGNSSPKLSSSAPDSDPLLDSSMSDVSLSDSSISVGEEFPRKDSVELAPEPLAYVEATPAASSAGDGTKLAESSKRGKRGAGGAAKKSKRKTPKIAAIGAIDAKTAPTPGANNPMVVTPVMTRVIPEPQPQPSTSPSADAAPALTAPQIAPVGMPASSTNVAERFFRSVSNSMTSIIHSNTPKGSLPTSLTPPPPSQGLSTSPSAPNYLSTTPPSGNSFLSSSYPPQAAAGPAPVEPVARREPTPIQVNVRTISEALPVSADRPGVSKEKMQQAIGEIKTDLKNFAKRIGLPTSIFSRSDKSAGSDPASGQGDQKSSLNAFFGTNQSLSSEKQAVDPLTRTAYEKLTAFNDIRSKPSVPVETKNLIKLQMIESLFLWISTVNPAAPPTIPESWLRNLLSSCFELGVTPHGYTPEWQDAEALRFVTYFLNILNLQDALFVCNERKFEQCIQFLLGKDDAAFEDWKTRTAAANSLTPTSGITPSTQFSHAVSARFQTKESIEALLANPIPESTAPEALNKLITKGDLALCLRYLPQLLKLATIQTVNFCAANYPSIQPWNVEKYIPVDTTQLPSVLLEYFSKLVTNRPECRTDKALVHRLFQLFIEDSTIDGDLVFDSTSPRRHSHNQYWRHGKKMLGIIRNGPFNPVSPTFTYEVSTLSGQCATAGFWKGQLQLLVFARKWLEALLLAFQLDDRASFESIVATPHITVAAWTSLLALVKQKETPSASASGDAEDSLDQARFEPDISMEFLVDKMCFAVGPQTTLVLLRNVFVGEGELERVVLRKLSQRMFSRILEYGRTQLMQRSIAHEVLEIVDSYLWSPKTEILSPSFRALEQLETQECRHKDNCLNDVPYVHITNTKPDGTPEYSVNLAHQPTPKRFFAEHSAHWGVTTQVRDQICPRCTLPLNGNVGRGKIHIFEPCGHALHDTCADEEACPICLTQSFKPLLPLASPVVVSEN